MSSQGMMLCTSGPWWVGSYERLLDLELPVDGVERPQEPGRVARDDTGQLGAPGLGVVGGGVERDTREAVVLPALEYRLDASGLVLVPVVLPDVAGRAVDHDVDLSVHVLQGSGYGDSGGVERLDALVGHIDVVSLGQSGLGLEVRSCLCDPDELHVILLCDRGCHSLSDGPVSVDCNPDFCHVVYLWNGLPAFLKTLRAEPDSSERVGCYNAHISSSTTAIYLESTIFSRFKCQLIVPTESVRKHD